MGVSWSGPALVDGKPWPLASDTTVWLPRGFHTVEAGAKPARLRVLDFNGDVTMAAVTGTGIEFAYQSSARAMAVLDRLPASLAIDGVAQAPQLLGNVLILPRGQHLATLGVTAIPGK